MIIPPVRPQDDYGSGEYKAPRGKRLHQGVDYACYAGSTVISNVSGFVSRLGYPYQTKGLRGEYRLIELITHEDIIVKYMYVMPIVRAGDEIKRGNAIGIVQDLSKIYPVDIDHPNGIINHYHVEVWVPSHSEDGFVIKKNINPKRYFEHGVIEEF